MYNKNIIFLIIFFYTYINNSSYTDCDQFSKLRFYIQRQLITYSPQDKDRANFILHILNHNVYGRFIQDSDVDSFQYFYINKRYFFTRNPDTLDWIITKKDVDNQTLLSTETLEK